jgi:hypothetical protein
MDNGRNVARESKASAEVNKVESKQSVIQQRVPSERRGDDQRKQAPAARAKSPNEGRLDGNWQSNARTENAAGDRAEPRREMRGDARKNDRKESPAAIEQMRTPESRREAPPASRPALAPQPAPQARMEQRQAERPGPAPQPRAEAPRAATPPAQRDQESRGRGKEGNGRSRDNDK